MATFHQAAIRLVLAHAIFFLGGMTHSARAEEPAPDRFPQEPKFSRHVIPLLARLGCNAGACHGKVKGENGFRLSLFGADPQQDHSSLLREFGGRRVNLVTPEASLLLLKPIGEVSHLGGKRLEKGSPEYQLLLRWLSSGAALDPLSDAKVTKLEIEPKQQTVALDGAISLRATAHFADGSREDVTPFCTFEPQRKEVVEVVKGSPGKLKAIGIGDSAIVVRYGAEPEVANVLVPGPAISFPQVKSHNFIDDHILAKLKALHLPPADLCDDATFLRRASLDVTGALPEAEEVRSFLADSAADKRAKKIEELLQRPGYAAMLSLRLCDVLRPNGFNQNNFKAPRADERRFYEWIRARLTENTPYDQIAERILIATSREGRSEEEWISEALKLSEEDARKKPDLTAYNTRKTLDLYWARENGTGVKGAVQISHALLGLRMECAQCHRHPHDIWKQDDLLSFANFFMRVKGAGESTKSPELAARLKKMDEEFKKLGEDAKKAVAAAKPKQDEAKAARAKCNEMLREIEQLEARAKDAKVEDAKKLLAEAADKRKSKLDPQVKKAEELEAAAKKMTDDADDLSAQARSRDYAKARLNATEVFAQIGSRFNGNTASVSSPLGTQRSDKFRLLGEKSPVEIGKEKDPRELVAEWIKRKDNPFFAKAIVNRVWSWYLGRGIVEPADQLSPLNPPSHPELLEELAQKFIESGYDLRWLHRTILTSRTYQQSSEPAEASRGDRSSYAWFMLRRMPAEVIYDAVNHAAGASETYPDELFLSPGAKAIELAGGTRPPEGGAKGTDIEYGLKVFGRPQRDTAVQCDCERDTTATIVQTLYLANHPRVREKLYSAEGRVAKLLAAVPDDAKRIEELYLATLSRLPDDDEKKTSMSYVAARKSSLLAFQDVLWSLVNTREFLLNH